MHHHTAIIALGSNLGDKHRNLQQARHCLRGAMRGLIASPIYETEPWGITEQPAFYNQVVMGQTSLKPQALLTFLHDIEQRLGRQHTVRFGPRPIDLDIIFYDDLSLTTYRLTIPHPRLVERAFVLVPLADIAPHWLHPRLGCSVRQLLSRVDSSSVQRLRDEQIE